MSIDNPKSRKMYDIIKRDSIQNKAGFMVVNSSDFELMYDVMDERVTLMWITKKTENFSGIDLFKGLVLYLKEIGVETITAWGVKGYIAKKEGVGYYVLLKWGFIPDKGIILINRMLKTSYKNFCEVYDDPKFFKLWQEKGRDFTGAFSLDKNSLSMKQLSKL